MIERLPRLQGDTTWHTENLQLGGITAEPDIHLAQAHRLALFDVQQQAWLGVRIGDLGAHLCLVITERPQCFLCLTLHTAARARQGLVVAISNRTDMRLDIGSEQAIPGLQTHIQLRLRPKTGTGQPQSSDEQMAEKMSGIHAPIVVARPANSKRHFHLLPIIQAGLLPPAALKSPRRQGASSASCERACGYDQSKPHRSLT